MAAQSSRMHLKQKVETPYGVGKIIEIRSGHYVVEPETWRLAAGQKPTFYMNPKDVKPFFKIGDSVRSVFGIGQVKDIRGENNTYVVTLNNWKLADGKSPTLYLNDDSMTREGPSAADLEQKAVEAKIEGVLSKVAQMREIAKDLYAQKKFEEAKAKYTEIMESLRLLGENIHGVQRARFLDHCIACHSNLALCSFNLSNWLDTVVFANNSLTLLDALESKIPSELWQHMQSLGYSEEKLADLKLKAYRIRGKAEVKRGNFDDAKQNFEAALKLSRVEKITKELDDLLMEVVKKRASEKKKEKALWQKAFNKRDAGVDDDEPEAASPAKPVRQDKPKPSTAAKEGTVTAQSGFSLTSFLGISVLGVGVGLAIWWLRKRSFK